MPHKDELLFVAINEAKAMAASGWRAPPKRLFPVAGRSAIATIKAQLVNMRDGGFISAYDFKIAAMIAEVVWRRRGRGQPGERGIPDAAGAQGVLPPDRPAQDA